MHCSLWVGAWSLHPRAADGTMLRASGIETLRGYWDKARVSGRGMEKNA